MTDTLEQVIESELADAVVLRRNGHAPDADVIERIVRRVKRAAEDYLVMIPERAAVMRSDHSVDWLRSRFAAWARDGHAEMRGGVRYYRQIVIPQRVHNSTVVIAARAAGAEAGRAAAMRSRTQRSN